MQAVRIRAGYKHLIYTSRSQIRCEILARLIAGVSFMVCRPLVLELRFGNDIAMRLASELQKICMKTVEYSTGQ